VTATVKANRQRFKQTN